MTCYMTGRARNENSRIGHYSQRGWFRGTVTLIDVLTASANLLIFKSILDKSEGAQAKGASW